MTLRIRERQRRAPGAAKYHPALEPQMRAQRLQIAYQVPGAVLVQFGMRTTGAAATLVEQHDAIALGIEEATHRGVGRAAGAAVQEHDRFSFRIAALLVIQFVQPGDAQVRLVKRPYRRIERVGGRAAGGGGAFGTAVAGVAAALGATAAFGRAAQPGGDPALCGGRALRARPRDARPCGPAASGRRPGGAIATLQVETIGPSGRPPGRGRGGGMATLKVEPMGPGGGPPSRWTCRWATSMPLSRLQLKISR